ncbi:cytosolic carboxypeptidase 3 isoform X7 [Macrotis lagotis]|uniref:cytosolic carboxypeptidase 3 isoform X7 n=1 Tax=Macrotis lagotis TaxID=92651 RepID=UPI003D696A37
MSEESDKDEHLTDRITSDEDELDNDAFMKFLSEDLHRCALFSDVIGDHPLPRTTQLLLEYQLGKWVPRLREPRDLYGVTSSGPLNQTRWPFHCEVVEEKVLHIDYAPPYPEPLYVSTGDEFEPHYPDSTQGTVVYLGSDGRLMEDREILLYCDLHGHSRKENIFMYGCEDSDEEKELCSGQRVFPFMLSKNCPNKFSFSACKFDVQKSKEGTGRVVMWKMGIHNSFTMEATFCGSTIGNRQGTHFNTKDLESMGYHFCDSLLDYFDPDQTKYHQCVKELEELTMQQLGIISSNKMYYESDASFIDTALDLDSSSDESDISEAGETLNFPKGTSQNKVRESEVTIPPDQERKNAKNRRMKILEITGKQMTIFSPFGEGPIFKKLQNQKVGSKGDVPQRHKETNPKAKGTKFFTEGKMNRGTKPLFKGLPQIHNALGQQRLIHWGEGPEHHIPGSLSFMVTKHESEGFTKRDGEEKERKRRKKKKNLWIQEFPSISHPTPQQVKAFTLSRYNAHLDTGYAMTINFVKLHPFPANKVQADIHVKNLRLPDPRKKVPNRIRNTRKRDREEMVIGNWT